MYGFIAQDIEQIFPDMVNYNLQDKMSMDYIQLIPLIVEQYQRLNKEFNRVKKELKQLKDNLNKK